jgi:hypothetical protein
MQVATNVVEPFKSMSNNSLVLIVGMGHVIVLTFASCDHSNFISSLVTLVHETSHIFVIIVTTIFFVMKYFNIVWQVHKRYHESTFLIPFFIIH